MAITIMHAFAARFAFDPALLVLAGCLLLHSVTASPASAYIGSDRCKHCHQSAWEYWRASDHYHSMLPASEATVLGDFNDATFEYAGLTHHFFRDQGRFLVTTDNAGGELQQFEINFTFGHHPLQQYLIGFPDGRFQALNIVWDSRPLAQGGQRWYHLYPDDAVTHSDILHWTGSFQNWNSRCAACHSTGLKKNYVAADNSYQTRWAEINVGCEACHGPGSAHSDWASGERASPDPGFVNALAGKGVWVQDAGKPTRRRQDGGNALAQAGTCAACHSRRMELDEDHAGKSFHDLFQLRLLENDAYYPDGQIRGEVYVYGSFLQSRMAQAGVACTNCHEPHSNALLAEGNALCGQCHQAEAFDQPAHHHHAPGNAGAACVNCHMPVTTYMGVDDRRDHSFRVPEPQFTLELGIPNACNRCHADQDAAWAGRAVQAWYPQSRVRADHAPVLAAAQQERRNALPGLIALADDASRPGILRATAVLEATRFPEQQTLELMQRRLADSDPLVRGAAARSLDWLSPASRYLALRPLITDPNKSVRIEAAHWLSDAPLSQLTTSSRSDLARLRKEYLGTLELNADMPESLLNMGSYLARSGQAREAEQAYRQALILSPAFVPAMINLADLYRETGKDDEAKTLLQSAIELEPGQAPPHHAMGLLLVRQKQMDQAISELRKAAELAPDNARYAYVFAVALYGQGQQQRAIAILEDMLRSHPGQPQLIAALRAYYQEQGMLMKLEALDAAGLR